jgi:chromosome segregation ATPase
MTFVDDHDLSRFLKRLHVDLELESNGRDVVEAIKLLCEKIIDLQQENIELGSQLGGLQYENHKNVYDCLKASKRNDQFEAQYKKNEEQLKKSHITKVSSLENKIEALNKSHVAHLSLIEDEIKELKKSVTSFERKQKSMKDREQSMRNKINSAKGELDVSKGEIAQLKGQLEEYVITIAKRDDAIGIVQSEYDTHVSSLEASISDMEEDAKISQSKLNSMRDENARVKERLEQECIASRNSVTEELQRLKEENLYLKKRNEDLKADKLPMEKQIESMWIALKSTHIADRITTTQTDFRQKSVYYQP